MLRKIRIAAAALFFVAITLMFLDFTGTLYAWFGWMAKIQLLPALLAVNAGAVLLVVVLTLLFGRIYCSAVCPLGVMQDIVSWGSGRRRRHRNRFRYTRALTWLRWTMLAVFVATLFAGAGTLLAPYSAYGRIVANLLAPVYVWGNNLLASVAERVDSYAFYTVDVWMKSLTALIAALATFAVVALLAWREGRTWCNTVCPVGTVLGALSRYSLFKPRFDTSKCNGCKLCARNCKASCIDPEAHRIDYSRCVACMDCLENCRQGAIGYTLRRSKTAAGAPPSAAGGPQEAAGEAQEVAGRPQEATEGAQEAAEGAQEAPDASRRSFLGVVGLMACSALRAQEKKVDGGLALIEEKKIPDRAVPVVPAGAQSLRRFATRCTGCQLCVTVCPNQVLRPSGDVGRLMKPEMSYERGYCRPECTKCSEVCPAGAILPVTAARKSATQIGHAVWIAANCVVNTDGVNCNNCSRHCPTGAIRMVHRVPGDPASPRIPAVDEERCIGCGACENLCPARPFSAIYVEGHERHRTV